MKIGIGGIIQVVVGAILIAVSPLVGGTTAPIGKALIVSGLLSIAAGFIFTPQKTEASDDERSATYGFNQFDNPVKGDTPFSVIYSNDTAAARPGHKVAPVYLAAFTTPRGYELGDDDAKIISQRGQGLSCLLAIGEGPVTDIGDIRANDEPLFDDRTAYPVGTGSGGAGLAARTFRIPVKRIDMESVRIYVAGTAVGWLPRVRRQQVAQGDGSKILFTVDLAGTAQFVTENAITFHLMSPTAAALSTESSTNVRPHAWMDGGGSDGASTRLYVNTQVPLNSVTTLFATWTERYLNGFTMGFDSNGELVLVFSAAVTGAITADFKRRRHPGLRVEWRRGGDNQLPIPDFASVRQTYGVGATLVRDVAQIISTSEPVDDVLVDVASLDQFTQYDRSTGDRSPVAAQFRIEYQQLSAAGTLVGTKKALRDPAGSRTGKNATEFEFRGDQTSRKYYTVSIRNVLRRHAENASDLTAQADLAAFTRSRYRVWVTRTNPVRASSLIYDEITLLSYQHVIDEALIYPGVALLAIHALASERLHGSAPRITCTVKGLRNVEAWDGSSWAAPSGDSVGTAQANPVWAAIDLITNKRYGGGQQFTKAANIDTASALIAATWCDGLVTADGVQEKRAVLDLVLDTRADLMTHVRNMLLPAQVIPVLRGNVWSFVVDRDVDLTTVPVVYDDTADGRTLKGSMSFSHQPITTQVTELQVSFFDRDSDFERSELWVAPTAPTGNRRIERAQVVGASRASQVTRYTKFLYEKARQQGAQAQWAMTPGGLRLQAGDVVRVASQRIGIDMYVRITKWEVDSTESMVVRVEAAQYIPAVYGINLAAQAILRRATRKHAPLSTTTLANAAAAATAPEPAISPRVQGRVRRVA